MVDELLLVPVVVSSSDELMTEVVAAPAQEMIEALGRGKKINGDEDDDKEEEEEEEGEGEEVGEERNEGADVGHELGGGSTLLLLGDSKVSLDDDSSDIRRPGDWL